MGSGRGHVSGSPGDTVGGATCHLGDLVAFQSMDQSWFPVHCGGAVSLLSMVIVSPCIYLKI